MRSRYRTREMQFFPECIVIACHGLSIKSFVWIFFIFALISFLITYIHVMVLLEGNVNDIQFGANYDYLDVPAIRAQEPNNQQASGKNHALKLGDDAREGKNMVSSKIMADPLTEIHGWWMPNVKWNAQIDCKTGMSHICRKPELKEAVKRTLTLILENGGIVRKIEYLGEKRLPYRMRAHNENFFVGKYFIVDFHAPTSVLPLMRNYFKREIDLIRPAFFRHETEANPIKPCEGVYQDIYQPKLKKNQKFLEKVEMGLKNIKL